MTEGWLTRLLGLFERSRRDASGPVLHMFIQDVHASIMPFRKKKGDRELQVVFEGEPDEVGVALRTCQALGQHPSVHKDPTESVCDAVREVVHHMLWRGYAAFEIAEKFPEPPPTKVHYGTEDFQHHYALDALTGEHLIRVPGRVLGMVRPSRRRWDRDQRLFRMRAANRVWFVRMPRALGGRGGYRRIVRKLERFPQTFPEWTAEALVKEQDDVRFSVSQYDRLRAAYHARSTGAWNWNGRDTSLNHQTEFFLFYRTVTFHHALAILREHVVNSLNGLFRHRLKLNAQIVLKDFPTPSEVLEVRRRMERAELSIGDAFDRVTL